MGAAALVSTNAHAVATLPDTEILRVKAIGREAVAGLRLAAAVPMRCPAFPWKKDAAFRILIHTIFQDNAKAA